VFGPKPDGRTPVLPDAVTQRFRRLAKRVGVATSLHGFRHCSATQLLAAGVDLRTVAASLAAVKAEAERRASSVVGRRRSRPDQLPPTTG
jgi:integrase